MDVNVNERKVHKVHIQDKKVKEQRADRCSKSLSPIGVLLLNTIASQIAF
jgi:hypothetical protein